MNRNEFLKTLEQLCGLRGISGQEQDICRGIYKMLEPVCDELSVDRSGNITATMRGVKEAPSLMFAAHIDQVGGIVNYIYPNGLLSFRTVGGVSRKTLPSTRVFVGDLPGVMTAPPAHMESADKTAVWDLMIDIGAESAADAASMGAQVGDGVCFAGDFTALGANRICSQSIDDRVGCALLVQMARELKSHPGDVILAFSVREETTMSGAHMLVQRCRPDCAIAIDTVPTDDTHSPNPRYGIGKGPVLQLMEGIQASFVGNAVHPAIKKSLLRLAGQKEIPIQLCADVGTWTTDGTALHRAGEGIPTGYISIPRRYAHSPSEVLDLRDAWHAYSLMEAFAADMDNLDLSFI